MWQKVALTLIGLGVLVLLGWWVKYRTVGFVVKDMAGV